MRLALGLLALLAVSAGALAQSLEPLSYSQQGLGGGELELQAYDAVEAGKLVRARELAERILDQDPDSFVGHCVLGIAQHRGEGNLPIALYHLKRCKKLFEDLHGAIPGEDRPWFWHGTVLDQLAAVSGEMGRHQDKLDYLELHDSLYKPSYPATRGWPLMRLRRYGEARRAVAEGLATGRDGQVAIAKTALCAIEAELHRREASYLACVEAMEFDRETRAGGPAVYTNAAEAALGMLKMDEAERYILEGTRRFVSGSVSNPWMDLALLYISEGRPAEALDALRRMLGWRNRQPAYMEEQNKAEAEMAAAVFLLFAGMGEEAARITSRALERPDRTGFTSSEPEQMQSAAALLDGLAHRLAAAQAEEEASWSGPLEAFGPRLRAATSLLRAWASERKAASLLGQDRMLLATLRPYLAGSMEAPQWIEPELCRILGPGLVATVLAEARRQETLAGAEGYFAAFEAEIAYLRSRRRQTLRAAERALELLPGSEVLLRARVAALAAATAERAGEKARAMELYDQAMQLDPGVIRRLDLSLPTRFESSGGDLAREASRLLRRSPRLRRSAAGFTLRVEGDEASATACLWGARDERLGCARVTPRAEETGRERARRLAAEVHRRLFAPRVDLTQSDLQSLDGSATAGGGRSAERMRNILDGLVGGEP